MSYATHLSDYLSMTPDFVDIVSSCVVPFCASLSALYTTLLKTPRQRVAFMRAIVEESEAAPRAPLELRIRVVVDALRTEHP